MPAAAPSRDRLEAHGPAGAQADGQTHASPRQRADGRDATAASDADHAAGPPPPTAPEADPTRDDDGPELSSWPILF